MSEDKHKKLVQRVLQSVAEPMISTDIGVEAAQKAGSGGRRMGGSGWIGYAPLWQPASDKGRRHYCLEELIADAATSAEFWRKQLHATSQQVHSPGRLDCTQRRLSEVTIARP